MNWDRIQGQWKLVTGKVKAQWGELTEDDIEVAAGRREQLAGMIQKRYGVASEEAAKQFAQWQRSISDLSFSHVGKPKSATASAHPK